ncbi:MAG: hypothetical protein Q8R38_04905 [Candidatus Omnitrophota bacterium]|nr:hypothetical protein [Candidatus Omnitrophota bacterium]
MFSDIPNCPRADRADNLSAPSDRPTIVVAIPRVIAVSPVRAVANLTWPSVAAFLAVS